MMLLPILLFGLWIFWGELLLSQFVWLAGIFCAGADHCHDMYTVFNEQTMHLSFQSVALDGTLFQKSGVISGGARYVCCQCDCLLSV